MTNVTALSLTPSAREWLTTTTSARVLSIFDHACNLINQDNAILALVTSERGLNPFAMVVASGERTLFQAVPADSEVGIEADCLRVGALHINFASARLWNPAPDWPALRRRFAADPSQFDELAAMVMELAGDSSLLDLFSPLSSGEKSGVRERSRVRQALLDRARRGAVEIVHGLLTGSAEHCLTGAKRLAGLGGGLTPAGDDFMVGVLLAAWAGLYGDERESLGRSIAEAAAPLTTTLSAAYLRAAARGECMAHWHTLFDAVLRSDARAMRAGATALMFIGHTSGADALAGFLAARCLAHA